MWFESSLSCSRLILNLIVFAVQGVINLRPARILFSLILLLSIPVPLVNFCAGQLKSLSNIRDVSGHPIWIPFILNLQHLDLLIWHSLSSILFFLSLQATHHIILFILVKGRFLRANYILSCWSMIVLCRCIKRHNLLLVNVWPHICHVYRLKKLLYRNSVLVGHARWLNVCIRKHRFVILLVRQIIINLLQLSVQRHMSKLRFSLHLIFITLLQIEKKKLRWRKITTFKGSCRQFRLWNDLGHKV